MAADVVETACGPVSGRRAEGVAPVREFLGIPFAAPPVGDRRWRPPQAPEPWTSTRSCTSFGPACPQPVLEHSASGALDPAAMDEDCLYLNVWTPAERADERLPVMVWIHGGAFVVGAASQPLYRGASLARRGVVVVTLNYRLGPLGFFASEPLAAEAEAGASGNYGLLDQIAALRWVRENIAGFGGDSGRVTVFGESAGAFSVARLMVSPLAEGLFHRAIAESGGPCGDWLMPRGKVSALDRVRAEWETTVREVARLGHADGGAGSGKGGSPARTGPDSAEALRLMRGVPARRLLEVTRPSFSLVGGAVFGPVVDGWVIPDFPVALFEEGRMDAVPLLTGSNAREGALFLRSTRDLKRWEYRLLLHEAFGARRDEVERMFPAERSRDVYEALEELITTLFFESASRFAADAVQRAGRPAYLYRFSRVPPTALGRELGCCHGSEIDYVFGNLDAHGGDVGPLDRELTDAMQRYWVAFAERGDPNVAGLPEWEPSGGGSGDGGRYRSLALGDEISMRDDGDADRVELGESIWREGRRPVPGDRAMDRAVAAVAAMGFGRARG